MSLPIELFSKVKGSLAGLKKKGRFSEAAFA